MEKQDHGSRRLAAQETPVTHASAEGQLTALRPAVQSPNANNAKTESLSRPVMQDPTERLQVRRTQTLLEKVVGIGRIRRTAEPPEKHIPQSAVLDTYTLKVQSGDPLTRPVEETLDIPAFLRRQAH